MLSCPSSLLWFSIFPFSPEISTKKSIFCVKCGKSFLSKQINFGMKWHCELRNGWKAFMFMSPFNILCNFSKHLFFSTQGVEILMFYKCLYNSFHFRVIYSCVKQAVLSFLCLSTISAAFWCSGISLVSGVVFKHSLGDVGWQIFRIQEKDPTLSRLHGI